MDVMLEVIRSSELLSAGSRRQYVGVEVRVIGDVPGR